MGTGNEGEGMLGQSNVSQRRIHWLAAPGTPRFVQGPLKDLVLWRTPKVTGALLSSVLLMYAVHMR